MPGRQWPQLECRGLTFRRRGSNHLGRYNGTLDPRSRYNGLAYLSLGVSWILLVDSWGAPLTGSTFPLSFVLGDDRLQRLLISRQA